MLLHPPISTLFPYTTLFRSDEVHAGVATARDDRLHRAHVGVQVELLAQRDVHRAIAPAHGRRERALRSEEHTSELQSHSDLVCRLLLEKKKTKESENVHGWV